MADSRLHPVRPVIGQDLEVARVGEGKGVVEGELRTVLGIGGGEGRPFQAFEHDVVWDGAVGRFDISRPFEVAAEVGGFAFEEVKVIACWGIVIALFLMCLLAGGCWW